MVGDRPHHRHRTYLCNVARLNSSSLHTAQGTKVCRYIWHSAGTLGWLFPMLKYKYIFNKIYGSNFIKHTRPFNGPLSGTTRVSRYQKGKPVWILLKQETVSGSGISWAVCKSALRSRQITTPAPHHSRFFTGRMPFLPPNQQCQSTEGTIYRTILSNSNRKLLWFEISKMLIAV